MRMTISRSQLSYSLSSISSLSDEYKRELQDDFVKYIYNEILGSLNKYSKSKLQADKVAKCLVLVENDCNYDYSIKLDSHNSSYKSIRLKEYGVSKSILNSSLTSMFIKYEKSIYSMWIKYLSNRGIV